MLRDEQVELVKRLWKASWSQRRIARATGVSRDSVRRIVGGERGPKVAPKVALVPPSRKLGRCPCCGGRVFLPCVACQVRQWVREHPSVMLHGGVHPAVFGARRHGDTEARRQGVRESGRHSDA